MGSLTVLAGLMFTLGTRPVKAFSRTYYYGLSSTDQALKDEKERLMKVADIKNLKDQFKERIDALDDGYKLYTLEKEVKVTEANIANKSTFDREFDRRLTHVRVKANEIKKTRYKNEIILALEYLEKMQQDIYFTESMKSNRLADLEKCLTTPSHIKDIRWFR